jgi:hypothetical protein
MSKPKCCVYIRNGASVKKLVIISRLIIALRHLDFSFVWEITAMKNRLDTAQRDPEPNPARLTNPESLRYGLS